MAMDIKRDPAILRKKKIRQGIYLGIGLLALGGVTVAVMQLRPAAPGVQATTLWYGTVKRGSMVRNVRGAGTLVPEEIRWITSTAAGRVDKIVLRPGAPVQVGTVILELSNPDLQQSVTNAELTYRTSEATLLNAKSAARAARMVQDSTQADAQSSLKLAQANLAAQQKLADMGLVPDLTIQQLKTSVDGAQNRVDLIKQQIKMTEENEQTQIAPQVAQVSQAKAAWDQVKRQLEDLKVKSTMNGVLQVVPVERGQSVGSGANLARVADPTRLKAEIRISETQTKDLEIGQSAEIDTRNGVVSGHVSRIDPASTNGTVGVDVTLEGELPRSARPDLSVDGTIELQRLENILYVERPTSGQENAKIGVFKVIATAGPVVNGQEAGHEAVRIQVELGRASVQFMEVKSGLAEGDHIVLSDMQQYDAFDRIRLN